MATMRVDRWPFKTEPGLQTHSHAKKMNRGRVKNVSAVFYRRLFALILYPGGNPAPYVALRLVEFKQLLDFVVERSV